MTEAEEKAIEYLKANSLVRLNENNEVVAYGNAHKYYIINLIKKLQKEIEDSIPKDKIKELFKELYMVKEIKFAKIKTTDNDKLYKFAKDIQKLLEEEE